MRIPAPPGKRSVLFVIHKHLITMFKAAAMRQKISLSEWVQQAIIEHIRGNYAHLPPETGPTTTEAPKPRRHVFHMNIESTVHDEIRLVAMERNQSMSAFVREAGRLRLREEENL